MPASAQLQAHSRSRFRVVVTAILLLSSRLAAQADRKPATIDQILALRAVSDVAMSPDGRWIVYTVTTRDLAANLNRSAVWLVASDGGTPRQLTRGQGADRGARWSPDGSYLAFLSDRDSSRKSQVFGLEPNGGEAWRMRALSSCTCALDLNARP